MEWQDQDAPIILGDLKEKPLVLTKQLHLLSKTLINSVQNG